MKKYFAILLAVIMLLSVFGAYALGEALTPVATDPPASQPLFTINLTGLIVAILVAFFEFLMAWLMKSVIPPLKNWLDSHATKNQQAVIWNVVKRLVEAAEQIFTGEGRGADKLDYVVDRLKEFGYSVDRYVIEAAVKEMNDQLWTDIEEVLEIYKDDNTEEDTPTDNADEGKAEE